ncbi:hypothetical protein RCH14_003839 [Massilia sp. MP_M2]|uniref:helix-turn-helix domain-containing protein n=1 Tax=Massilia sp. MP_M2 TaxID=3071713 RepID=UPI00319DB234
MEHIKLTALRDFAIEYIPRAQHTRSQSHANIDDYHRALYGVAVLTLAAPKSSAVEQTAAQLLQVVTSMLVAWDEFRRMTPQLQKENDDEAVSNALELSTLTGISLPFLSAPTDRPTLPDEPKKQPRLASSHNQEQTIDLPPLKPGLMLTTREAADYLRLEVQTLHKWSSSGNGAVTPVKIGKRPLRWPSTDILRIMEGKT